MAAKVAITGAGTCLPGEPVSSDRIDAVLGPIPGLSPSLQGRARRLQEAILKRTGVRQRHYALDPKTRAQTETNVSIAEKAVRPALEMAGIPATDIDLLVIAAPMADYACPPTSALLQDRLGIEKCVEIEVHSNCTGTPKALQIAFDMLRIGRYRRAVVAYTQLSSVFLRSEFYTPGRVGLENLALRWIMSDGAGALVLERDGDGIELLDVHVESIGGLEPAGMVGFSHGGFAHDTPLDGAPFLQSLSMSGAQHVAQDISRVSRLAPGHLVEGLANMLDAGGRKGDGVAEFLLGIPGRHFVSEKIRDYFIKTVDTDPEGRLDFTWVDDFGYCGGATMLVQFDRLMRSGRLKSGDVIAAYLEESSKWMSGGFLARA